jgi:predicted alpha/beta-fold hydrolase
MCAETRWKAAGFKTVEDYYKAAGSHQRVGGVARPLLVIQAADDPIAPIAGTPREALYANPNCILAGS